MKKNYLTVKKNSNYCWLIQGLLSDSHLEMHKTLPCNKSWDLDSHRPAFCALPAIFVKLLSLSKGVI